MSPTEAEGCGGRILLRIPKTLHAELIVAAEREGVSLNQFCALALSGAVSWRAPARSRRPTSVPRGRIPGVPAR